MKQKILIISAVVAVLMISGCNMMSGSGILVETEFQTYDYTAVEAGSVCDLTVTRGDEFNVTVTCDDNLTQYLVVENNSGVLKIGLQHFTSYNHITFKADVVMPELESVVLSGASKITATGFATDGSFNVELSGASKGSLNFILTEDIEADISGASEISLDSDAMTGDLLINCSGASKADMRDCVAYNVKASVSGASSVWVNLSGNIKGKVSGASSLYYKGTTDTHGLSVDSAASMIKF